jgi:hypothetical protein
MTIDTKRPMIDRALNLSTIDAIASVLGRYGLVIVIGWIGALKDIPLLGLSFWTLADAIRAANRKTG